MSQNQDYKPPAGVLASNQLDITTHVDQGVVRSSDADVSVSVPAGWSFPVRNSAGMPIADPAAIAPDHIVDLGPSAGGETTVEVAIMMGLLTRNGAGHVVPVGSATVPQRQQEAGDQAKEQQQQQQQEEPNPSLDPESEAILANALTNAPSETIGVAVSVIENGGEVTDASVAQLAARLSLEPEAARAQIEQARNAYATEAYNETAKAVGTSAKVVKDALDAAQADPKTQSAFRRAAEAHFHSGRPDYSALVRDYVANLDQTDPQRILNSTPVAGRSVRWDQNSKQVLVRLPDGDEVSWSVAVTMGLITIK
jgi:hypothetical protein